VNNPQCAPVVKFISKESDVKGTHAALPPSSAVFLGMAQFREILRQICFSKSRVVIIEVPVYDPDQLPDDSKPNGLTHKSKSVFHWPPDCLWPFMEHRSDDDT
jgi:hypothetical protein